MLVGPRVHGQISGSGVGVFDIEECHPRKLVINRNDYGLFQRRGSAAEYGSETGPQTITHGLASLLLKREVFDSVPRYENEFRRREIPNHALLPSEDGDNAAVHCGVELNADVLTSNAHALCREAWDAHQHKRYDHSGWSLVHLA